ncbi:hypothetical protein NSZ01_23790 [Nocardioides szechwanensis]|nr:hypothetical protein NSZ01_23790 [Nocardioides szechwanensis]
MSTAAGASMLAHTVHYAVVLGGVLGLALLLLPHALERLRVESAPARSAHEDRVLRLRELAAVGRLAEPGATLTAVRPVREVAPTPRAAPAALPVALVSSAAAAGVHAAVGPAHLTDQPLVGMFFLACAAAQLGWSALFLARPGRALLEAGVVGNAALVTLWALSRLSGSEPVGPWDLAATGWEIAVVLACVALKAPAGLRTAGWFDWPGLARGWTACSVLLLALLSLSGAGA